MRIKLPPLKFSESDFAQFNTPRDDDPTPEEIKAACAEIQQNWTDDERTTRATGINQGDQGILKHWTAPINVSPGTR